MGGQEGYDQAGGGGGGVEREEGRNDSVPSPLHGRNGIVHMHLKVLSIPGQFYVALTSHTNSYTTCMMACDNIVALMCAFMCPCRH